MQQILEIQCVCIRINHREFPNSIGEAMQVGCPVVTSDVGGVKNLLEHGKEGFVYQFCAPYMLACYINNIFEGD